MNDAATWRLELARKIAPIYVRHPKVAAVGVAGSVSRGHADRYSDIEIFVYWAEPPLAEERTALAEYAGAAERRDYGWDDDYREWAEDYLVRGVKIDLTHHSIETIETFLDDVLVRFDITDHKTDQLAQLRTLVLVSGEDLIRGWQERAARYPDGLALTIMRKKLEFGPRIWAEMLAAREDVVALHAIYVMAMQRILAVLEALNRIYHRPGDKWTDLIIAEMRIVPPELPARLKAILRAEPSEGVRLLHQIMDETISLVEERMPSVNTSPVRARIAYPRPVWDDAPPE